MNKLFGNRVVSMLLVFAMLISVIPAGVFAEGQANAETDWAAKAAAVKLTGKWRDDLVAIAQSQLGYAEEDGVSLYGVWNGTPEADWTALFINWVATQAGLTEKQFPHGSTYKYLRIEMNDRGALIRASRYNFPSIGDLALIEVDGKKLVGIITYIDNGVAAVIHGDDNGAVTRDTYTIGTAEFDYYVNLDVLMEKAGIDLKKGGDVPALPENGVIAWTNANSVSIREERTTASKRVGTVKKSGAVLTVTSAQKADDGYIWYGVNYEGTIGFIRGDLLTLDKQALPAVTATPVPTVVPTVAPTAAPEEEAADVVLPAELEGAFEAAVAKYYREFEDENWILIESMLAWMTNEELAACCVDLSNAMMAADAMTEEEKAQYAAELAFLTELYEAVSTPLTVQSRSEGLYDSSVSGGYFKVTSSNSYKLADGAIEHEFSLNNEAGNDRKAVHVFEVDVNGGDIEVLPGYYYIHKLVEDYDALGADAYAKTPVAGPDKMEPFANNFKVTKAEQLTKTVAYYRSQGYNVVGAMNTALAYDSDAPYGYMVFNGKVLCTPEDHKGAQTYLVTYKNEEGKIECELRSMSEPLKGNEIMAVSANFGWLVKDGKMTSTSVERTSSDASRSMIGIKPDGTLLFVLCDGRNSPVSGGLSNYEMGEMMQALGCQWAVNCDGGGSSTFVSKRSTDAAPVMRSVPSDGSERPTINSVILVKKGGGIAGQLDRVAVNSEYKYIMPGAKYTVEALAFDGEDAPMTMPYGGVWSLSDDSFGTIENGVFTSNGKKGTVEIQFTLGKHSDAFAVTVCDPELISFAFEETVLPYGEGMELELVAYADKNEQLTSGMFVAGEAFTWTTNNEAAGTLDAAALMYTATTNQTISGVTLTATYKYVDNAQPLTLHIEFGKGSEILDGWTFESSSHAYDFMGFNEAKAWSEANGVKNTLVGSEPLAGQFSPQMNLDTFWANASNGQVKNGSHSLGVTLDQRTSEFAGWTYNVLFYLGEAKVLRDVANGQNATSLGMWVYIPEGAAGLAFQSQLYVRNADGSLSCKQDHFMFTSALTGKLTNLNSATEADIPANRWVYASIDISKYDYLQTPDPADESNSRSPSFLRTYIKPIFPATLTFYIDDITLDYSSAVPDRNEPEITDISYSSADEAKALDEAGNTTIPAASASFSAKVADNNTGKMTGLDAATGKIYLDGVPVDAQVAGNVLSTKNDIALINGDHKVTFEITDKAGNTAQKSVVFKVQAADNDAKVSLTGHNDSGKLAEYDSIYYVDVKTNDAAQVETFVANIQLNTANTWELDGMYVAPGYEVEYKLLDADREYKSELSVQSRDVTDIHSVENVVSITLTRKAACTLTGEQTLLSLPVRVWSWNGFDNVTGKPITPETQFDTGYCPVVKIEYEVLSGYFKNANGEEIPVYGSASIETMLNDNVNPWHYHDAELTVLSKDPTCTEAGYAGRTYCETCQSVVDWGTVVPATGHTYVVDGDALKCACGHAATGSGIVKSADGKLYCLLADKLVTKWQMVEGAGWCYANPTTKVVAVGEFTVSGLTYTADENGIVVKGAWKTDSKGVKYSYGPDFYKRTWAEIDGATYYFDEDTYMFTGIRAIPVNRSNVKEGYHVYDFGADGKLVYDYADFSGIVATNGDGMYYLEDGLSVYAGLILVDGYYYYARTGGTLVCGKTYWTTKTNDLLPANNYTFGEDGKMLNPPVVEPEQPDPDQPDPDQPDPDEPVVPQKKNGIVEEGGKLYWYVDDVKTYGGLLHLDTDGDEVADAYYYARSSGEILVNTKYWISKTNDLLPAGYYTFGADGKMVNPPVVEPEQPDPEQPDPDQPDPDQPDPDEPVVPEKKNGIVEEGGKLYWYVDDVKTYGGLLHLDADGDGAADAYYYARSSGEILRNQKYWITKTNDLLPAGYYTFGADGKMVNPPVVEPEQPDPEQPDPEQPDPDEPVVPEKKNGIIEEGGKLWWYVDDVKTYGGLMLIDGDYYYARSSGEILTNTKYWISKTNDLLPAAYYTFGADGKMVNPPAGN